MNRIFNCEISKRRRRIIPIFGRFLLALVLLVGVRFAVPKSLDSANLTSVKDTLETSRLSYDNQNTSGIVASTNVVRIETSGNPSTSTANIFPGDTIRYVATGNTYFVDQIISTNEFSLTANLNAADDDENDQLVIVRTASHVVNFTTATGIANGSFRVKIKAATSNGNDGNPDQTGFDFNTMNAGGTGPTTNVTCPADTADYTFGTGNQITATASAGAGCTTGYNCFECRYSGAGAISTGMTMTIGGTVELVNPAPAAAHTEGTADTYSVIIENINANNTVIDATTAKVAVIESVRVTATVDPRIEFTLTGVTGNSGTVCGVTRTASSPDSTATAVPFGSLTLAAFNDAAQQISCVTNASGGYVVTAIEDDQLSVDGDDSVTIADTTCEGGAACNESTAAREWNTTNTGSAFGFSIQDVDTTSVPFTWDATGTCSGAGYTGDVTCTACTGTGYCAMKFPATAEAETAFKIMENTGTPSVTEDIYLCYRLTVSTVQTAGNYENNITYRATATF